MSIQTNVARRESQAVDCRISSRYRKSLQETPVWASATESVNEENLSVRKYEKTVMENEHVGSYWPRNGTA